MMGDVDTEELKALVQVLCDSCDGSGRVKWDTPTSGGYSAEHTKPCSVCSERGHFETAVPITDFKRLLGLP
jgi:hypothetical protein